METYREYENFLNDRIINGSSLRNLLNDYIKYKQKFGDCEKLDIQEFIFFLWHFENKMHVRATRRSEFLEFPNEVWENIDKYMFPNMNTQDYYSTISSYFRNSLDKSYFSRVVTKESLIVGKSVASLIVETLWNNYLFDKKTNADILELEEMKACILDLYDVISMKLASLYHFDYRIKISNFTKEFLPYYFFEYLFRGFEELRDQYFNRGRVKLCIDLEEGYYTDKDRREYSGYPYKQFERCILGEDVQSLVKKLDSAKE